MLIFCAQNHCNFNKVTLFKEGFRCRVPCGSLVKSYSAKVSCKTAFSTVYESRASLALGIAVGSPAVPFRFIYNFLVHVLLFEPIALLSLCKCRGTTNCFTVDRYTSWRNVLVARPGWCLLLCSQRLAASISHIIGAGMSGPRSRLGYCVNCRRRLSCISEQSLRRHSPSVAELLDWPL